MNVLDAAKRIAPKIGIEVPDELMASTRREHVELREVMREAAAAIRDHTDWQSLKALATITGDGTAEDWPLPANFHAMPNEAQIHSTRYAGPLYHVQSHDDWLAIETRGFTHVVPSWMILGDRLHIKPVLADGEEAKFYYVVTDLFEKAGVRKADMTTDEDVFLLDFRAFYLATVWRWKHDKGLPYAEDMQNAEIALADAARRNAGPRVFHLGGTPRLRRFKTFWPGEARP